jgi:hypothetical protein
LNLSADCFVGLGTTKQFGRVTKPFPAFAQTSGNNHWLPKEQQKRRTAPADQPGDSQMRTLSFILAFAFVVAGSSIAGTSDAGLPGAGTFAYNGSPVVISAPQPVVVAAR